MKQNARKEAKKPVANNFGSVSGRNGRDQGNFFLMTKEWSSHSLTGRDVDNVREGAYA